jgi:hypothetical protein
MIKKIILSPMADFVDDTPPTIDGNALHYRGEQFDLTDLAEDAPVRVDGDTVIVQYRYNMETAEDNQPTDWAAYTFDAKKPIVCPIKRVAEIEAE